jgi:hypothetical protein
MLPHWWAPEKRTSVVVVFLFLSLSLSIEACVSDCEQQDGIRDGSLGRTELVSKRLVWLCNMLLAWKWSQLWRVLMTVYGQNQSRDW